MLKPIITTAALLSLFAATRAEGAEPIQAPVMATPGFIWLGNGVQVMDYLRKPGEVAASFRVEPKPVPEGTQLVFELLTIRQAEQTVRWRCVAETNIDECFPQAVIVGFRSGDEALRLQVQQLDPSGDPSEPLHLALGR